MQTSRYDVPGADPLAESTPPTVRRYWHPEPHQPPTLAEQLRDDVAPLIEAWTDNAGTYTCDEADHLAHLIALAIGARPAVAFLAAHCETDEPGDRHFDHAFAAAQRIDRHDAYTVACETTPPSRVSRPSGTPGRPPGCPPAWTRPAE